MSCSCLHSTFVEVLITVLSNILTPVEFQEISLLLKRKHCHVQMLK